MIQEGGYARFHESDIDARLKAFWDDYTWEAVPAPEAVVRTLLNIRYDTLIDLDLV